MQPKTWLEVSLNGPWGRGRAAAHPGGRGRDRRGRRRLRQGRRGHRPRARLRRSERQAEGGCRALRAHHLRHPLRLRCHRLSHHPGAGAGCLSARTRRRPSASLTLEELAQARPARVGGGRSRLGQRRVLRRAARGQGGVRLPQSRGPHPPRAWTCAALPLSPRLRDLRAGLRAAGRHAALALQLPSPIYRFMFSSGYTFGFPPDDYGLDGLSDAARPSGAGRAVDGRRLVGGRAAA